MNNFLALVITFALALAWLRLMDFAAQRGWIESRLSRKLIHIGTGPLFVLCWLLFKDTPEARWLAALVPFLFWDTATGEELSWLALPAPSPVVCRAGGSPFV